MTTRGKLFFTLVILIATGIGVWRWWPKIAPSLTASPRTPASAPALENPGNPDAQPSTAATQKPALTASTEVVEIGIAYGTEKERWLKWAVEEFALTPAGRSVRINLIPMGSIEAAQAITGGDSRIHVWSPASALYTGNFAQEFELKYNRKPIAKEDRLALTPMVFVSWDQRSEVFRQKYTNFTFKTLALALKEKGGWNSIAQKPEWGFFKFAHTHPNQSASGLLTLILMAYDFHDKERNLTLSDVTDVEFQSWLNDIESSVTDLPNSTANMMKEMVLKGPSSYDMVLVYESVAIDFLKNAEGRWGKLRVTYPRKNLWSENPYYILNAPWSEKKHRDAADAFLTFLMGEPAQKMALTHGFRPGNPNVTILFPESPFTLYQKYGLQVDLPTMCEAPSPEIVHNLLVGWNNTVRRR